MTEAAENRILFGKGAGKTPSDILLESVSRQAGDVLAQAELIKKQHDSTVEQRDAAAQTANALTRQRGHKRKQLREVTGLGSRVAASRLRNEMSQLKTERYFVEQHAAQLEQTRLDTLDAAAKHLEEHREVYKDTAQSELAAHQAESHSSNLPPATHAPQRGLE